ncbi:MAG: WD40 repeat domain-containing protein [Saprospiraceae bacterium]
MNTIFAILFYFLCLSYPIYSQNSCYRILINEGRELFKKKHYERAINKYLAALNCDSINQNELAALIKQAQRARQNELIRERNTARANALTAQSILALKQAKNPTIACRLALEALNMHTGSIAAQAAFLDAWYSQVFLWKGAYYAVPMGKSYLQTGILGSAVLSPDGRTFATASWDPPIVKLWPLAGGDTVSLLGFGDPVWRLRYSPDGSRLAAASLDGTVRIYSGEGQGILRLSDHDGPVYDCKFSSDGAYLVSGSQDGSAIVWDMKTGQAVFRLADSTLGAIKAVAFSADNSRILAAGESGKAVVWTLTGQQLAVLEHGILPLQDAFFTPDGRHIATAGEDGKVRVWTAQGMPVGDHGQLSRVEALVAAPGGDLLVAGSRDGMITVIDLEGGPVRTFQAHSDAVNGIVFAPDSLHFLSYSSDNTIKIWTVDGRLRLTLGEFTGPVLAAGFSADGNTVYGSSWDGSARLFPLTGHPVETYTGLGGNVQRVYFSPGGEKLIAVSLNGRAKLWHSDSGQSEDCIPHAGWLRDATFSPDGGQALITGDSGVILWNFSRHAWIRLPHSGACTARFFPNGTILTGASDGSLKQWTADGNPLPDLSGASTAINALAISVDGKTVASGHHDGSVALWSARNKELVWQHQYHTGEPVNSVDFSPDGQFLLSAGSDDRAFLWNKKGDPLQVYKHAGPVSNAVFASAGRRVLSYAADGTTKLWKTQEETPEVVLRTPTVINCTALAPDESFIATASNDGLIRLWSPDGALLASLPASDRTLNWIAFSPKGDYLLSAAADGRIHRWDLNPFRLASDQTTTESH